MDPQQNSFGAFLKDRRLAAGVTQRSLAMKLEVTRQHMSDLEAGKRLPSAELAEGIASQLQLSSADRDLMRDVIARDKEAVPTDLGGYIMDTDLARVALRRARDTKLSAQGWEKVIEVIESEAGDGER
ncbi:helix-turn-helix domain-containing protein [Rothia sp. ZJ1223]|uniref:helix-turn-helix domain-containing protein n=1 Tax=Rothia sp. ZJ1223 TaxID=2811098 RepID=UPI00195A00A7|nr:helix-turn-helix transcriptional regulator [Rothia sp. ZJ1223]MBM7051703.1 helix-turn-helix transcriptional regulator [Rothia sp. ZJ1223]